MEFEDYDKNYMQEWLEAASMTGYYTPQGLSTVKHRRGYDADSDDSDEDGIYYPSDSTSSETSDESMETPRPAPFRPQQEKGAPRWYKNQPFRYNGRIAMITIPGFLLVLVLGGDMFLTIVTLGMLCIHLLHVSEERDKSMIAYLVTFVCVQLSVIYSAVPLLWKSVYNSILIVALNVYSVLTGAWIMMAFDSFRTKEPELVILVETLLFSLYPACAVVLITWVMVSMTASYIAPYCFLFSGFALLQWFLTPTPTSFVKVDPKQREERFVLDPPMVGLMALLYMICPSILFVFTRLSLGFAAVRSLSFLIEFCIIFSGSLFLATFFNLRLFLETSGITLEQLIKARWVSGLATMYLLGPLLGAYGVNSHLLPWLPVVTTAYAVNGALLSRRSKVGSRLSTTGMAVVIVTVVAMLPWGLDYYLSRVISMSAVNCLLLVNALLCVLCTYGAAGFTSESFGLVWILQSAVCVATEYLLVSNQLLSHYIVCGIALLVSYLTAKLCSSGWLLWQHSIIISCLHISLSMAYQLFSDDDGLWNMYTFISTACLSAVLLVVFAHETSPYISREKFLRYVTTTGVVSLLSVNTPVHAVLVVTTQSPVLVSHHVGICLGTAGLVMVKLAFIHKCDWPAARYLAPGIFLLSFLFLVLSPQFVLERYEFSKWFLLILVVGAGVTGKAWSGSRSTCITVTMAIMMGFPIGFFLTAGLYGDGASLLIQASYSWFAILCVLQGLIVWQQHPRAEGYINATFVVLAMTSVTAILLDITSVQEPVIDHEESAQMSEWYTTIVSVWEYYPGCLAATLAMIAESAIFKSMAFMHLKLPISVSAKKSPGKPAWPVLGNIATITAFIILCIFAPGDFRLPWVIMCSFIFLLLQRDHIILPGINPHNHMSPIIMVAIVTSTIITINNSEIWTTKSNWIYVLCLFELLTVALSFPIIWNLYRVSWLGHEHGSAKTIFFLVPTYSVMLLFGSSYTSWFLGVLGLATGSWMMKKQLDLENEKS